MGGYDDVGHVLKCSGLLRMEISLASRLAEMRRRVVHITMRLRRS
jgi:hypothetical protein